ncbi:MAG TPA: glycosyltransferase family 4 protein [Acidimicrobiia bacterium]
MTDPGADVVDKLGDLAAEAGIGRIHVLAWRDLDDPEAGGSELHAHEVLRLWSAAGIEINLRTSYSAGKPQVVWRDGYRVIRKAGRYLVFPRSVLSEVTNRHGARDALVEIWNGMPFFSPVWCRGPRVTWLHHVHDTMWEMTLPPRLARFGRAIEFDIAPPVYRLTHTPVVTLSESSKRELVERLHFRARDVHVIPVGIGAQYTPGAPAKSPTPLVVAVGRLVPVKQFPQLVDALIDARRRVPNLEAVIVGEGYDRAIIEQRIAEAQAEGWLRLTGFVHDDEKIDWYRRAWLLASASAHEGWGMTVTEAAACGTPSVVTDIAGHRDAVANERSGLLVPGPDDLGPAMARVLTDDDLRARLSAGALEHSRRFTWGATAFGTLQVLCGRRSGTPEQR